MRRYRLRYFPEAKVALRDAATYVLTHSGDNRAKNWLRTMLSSIDQLEQFPQAFPEITVLEGRIIRAKLVDPYRVYYTIEETISTVSVVDIVHTSRDTILKKYRTGPHAPADPKS